MALPRPGTSPHTLMGELALGFPPTLAKIATLIWLLTPTPLNPGILRSTTTTVAMVFYSAQ